MAGDKMKEAGTTHWAGIDPNSGADNNSSGFTARANGYRSYFSYGGGIFHNRYIAAGWWSATEYSTGEAKDLSLIYSAPVVYRSSPFKHIGYGVRCVRD